MPVGRVYVGENQRSVKQSNRATIFQAIHALGPIARVDLAQRTGLNAGTVSNIVDELLAEGLASETGYRSSGRAGRRPVYIEIRPSARYAVGIDVARNAVSGALVDLSGQLRDLVVRKTSRSRRGDLALSTARQVVDRLLAKLTPDERSRVVGVGVGLPSPVSISSDGYLAPQSFGAWKELTLVKELASELQLPTYVDNNANTSALAERWFGAGQGVDNFLLVNLGTGVGTGLVLGGDLYRGRGLAGEGGHITVDLNGPRCACGNFGCLEMYASVPRVLASIRTALATGEESLIGESDELTIELAIAALRQGDALTSRVFADVARYLAAGIVNLINTLDPELVLVGRELAMAGDALFEPLRLEVRRRVFPVLHDSVRIEAAALTDAPVIGAGTLALQHYFAAPLGR